MQLKGDPTQISRNAASSQGGTVSSAGALSDMPAVKTFALYATVALLLDFLFQITCFISLLALDDRRYEVRGMDIKSCATGSITGHLSRPGLGPTQPPIEWVQGHFPWSKTVGAWR
jgi:hypothetical protein